MDHYVTWEVEHYPTLPSTNDYCIEQAKLNKKIDLAVLADSQSAPRGSRGRLWTEPKGNLALSFLYWPSFSIEKINWLPFVASIALYDAISKLCGYSENLKIKWPNDLIYKDKKIAGILIESDIRYPSVLNWLVIGFGLNISHAPTVIGREVGCLRDFVEKSIPSPLQVTEELKNYLTYWLNCLKDDKQDLIREHWLKNGLRFGKTLTVAHGNIAYVGQYQGIDEAGYLLLNTKNGLKKISAGEILSLDQAKDY